MVVQRDGLAVRDFSPFEAISLWVMNPDEEDAELSLSVWDNDGNRSFPIPSTVTIKPGEWFGELAAILHSTRTASVRAITPCEVLMFAGIKDTGLFATLAKDPKMIQKLLDQLCFRLVETSQRHSKDTGELAEQSMRFRRAIGATLFALEKLSEKYKSRVMEEVRGQLASMSGIVIGQVSDADPKFFPTSRDVIFGK